MPYYSMYIDINTNISVYTYINIYVNICVYILYAFIYTHTQSTLKYRNHFQTAHISILLLMPDNSHTYNTSLSKAVNIPPTASKNLLLFS